MKAELRARMVEKLAKYNEEVDRRKLTSAERAALARDAEAAFGRSLSTVILPAIVDVSEELNGLKHQTYVALHGTTATLRIRPYGHDDDPGWPHTPSRFPEVSFAFHDANHKMQVSFWRGAEGDAQIETYFVAIDQITADSVHASILELVEHMTRSED